MRLRRLLNRTLAAWVSIGALLVLATIQPSAYGLEFPAASRIEIPDATNLTITPNTTPNATPPITTAALFSQVQSTTVVSANELARVSLQSSQIELARSITGAQTVAKEIMATEYSWDAHQFACLKTLWTNESHWNYKAHNYSSGAHGIAQALPADKMDVIGTDWRTNPVTQIRWGLHYIDVRYSTPCKALGTFNWQGSY